MSRGGELIMNKQLLKKALDKANKLHDEWVLMLIGFITTGGNPTTAEVEFLQSYINE